VVDTVVMDINYETGKRLDVVWKWDAISSCLNELSTDETVLNSKLLTQPR